MWSGDGSSPAIRRLVWWGWGTAGLGAVTEYLAEGPYAAGTGLDTLVRPGLLDATLPVLRELP